MKLEDIKKAVDEGYTVCWKNPSYTVINSNGRYLIRHESDCYIGLHGLIGTEYEHVLNGIECDFYKAMG